MKARSLTTLLLLFWVVGSPLCAAGQEPITPGPRERCPVCGMFVAKYPDFVAILTFNDGNPVFFDGVKDMMKYYFNLKKYSPAKRVEDIVQIQVTDYYTLNLIDGFKAFYVSGSDVYGPMGRELIPFEKKEGAEEFLRDHKGKATFGFRDIRYDIVKGLDRPR
jgi:copper chaperone NosL